MKLVRHSVFVFAAPAQEHTHQPNASLAPSQDIEGQELAVLPTLYDRERGQGAWCAIDESFIEVHAHPSQEYFNHSELVHLTAMYRSLKKDLHRHNCSRVVEMDDERYANDRRRVLNLGWSQECFAGDGRFCQEMTG